MYLHRHESHASNSFSAGAAVAWISCDGRPACATCARNGVSKRVERIPSAAVGPCWRRVRPESGIGSDVGWSLDFGGRRRSARQPAVLCTCKDAGFCGRPCRGLIIGPRETRMPRFLMSRNHSTIEDCRLPGSLPRASLSTVPLSIASGIHAEHGLLFQRLSLKQTRWRPLLSRAMRRPLCRRTASRLVDDQPP